MTQVGGAEWRVVVVVCGEVLDAGVARVVVDSVWQVWAVRGGGDESPPPDKANVAAASLSCVCGVACSLAPASPVSSWW
ncbi:hypothetical protein E2C01_081667 [Portunus trituberculatus]|uniref:Uncharacterized protein n=1 Tax=Portunus trituberculatus TaxID=210409 RepID=A0A5B7IN16_PORTR|nr:hypothetical protein [Portunus trituberculatus]